MDIVGVAFESLALYQDKREQGNRQYLKLANDEHLVRLHIGLEDPNDLITDLKNLLKTLNEFRKIYSK